MANINTTANISSGMQAFYNKSFLARLLPGQKYELFADRKPLPKNSSKTQTFTKYTSREPAMVPLSEAVVPDGGLMDYSEVSFDLEQYGDYLKFSDWVELTQPDAALSEGNKINSEQAERTINLVRRDAFMAGTQVRRAGGVAARTSIINTITVNDLKVVDRAMSRNYCSYIKDMVKPDAGYATSPTRAAYMCIAHSDLKADIEALTGFIGVEKYANQTSVDPDEIGQWGNFRFIIDNDGKKWADGGGTAVTNSLEYTTSTAACDVYAILIYSAHAVAVTDLQGESMRVIVKPRGSGGPDQPLDQYGTIGWVSFLAQGILDEARLYRLECGASKLT
jgi:N4-gp56 family major capsid protein